MSQGSSQNQTTPSSNPQYSPLDTEVQQQRRRQKTHDEVLQNYVDNFVHSNIILASLHKFRTVVTKYYNPVATLVLAVVFFLARRAKIDENCKGKADDWTQYGLIYFSVMSVYEMIRLIADTGSLTGLKNILENSKLKPLMPFVNGIDIFSNIGINIGIMYAFFEREECPALSPYLNWWAVLEFVPLLSLGVTLIMTVVTLVAFLHYEKKRLD